MDAKEIRNLHEAYLEVYGESAVGDRARRAARKAEDMVKSGKARFEEVDVYDVVLSHLLDEGYADTQEAAEVIMANMTEDWRNEIVEAYGRYGGRRGYFNSVGQADRTGGRYKYLGSPTDPKEIEADEARAAAARAKHAEAERKRKAGGQG